MLSTNSLYHKSIFFLLPLLLFFTTGLHPVSAKTLQYNSLANPTLQNLTVSLKKQRFYPPTQSEIKVCTGYDKEMMNFSPEFFISNERTDLNWKFQWSTSQKGTEKAIYQVSLFPFNNTSDNWKNPPGLVLSGNVGQVRTDGTRLIFNLDIARINQAAMGRQKIPLPKKTVRSGKSSPTLIKKSFQVKEKSLRISVKPVSTDRQLGRMVLGPKPAIPILTYYIRIVTLKANNTMIGLPSKPAIFHYGKQTESVVKWYGDPSKSTPPPREKINNPIFKILEYRPFHDYRPDWPYRYVITKDVNLIGLQYHKGQKVHWPPNSGSNSIWDKVSDTFGSLVDFVKKGVNAISEGYQSIKNQVLEFAVNLFPGCGEYPPCQTGLAFAMDYGLAAIGLPPSVPNFDDLKTMGKDYLVQYAAEQSNLPVEDAVKVIEKYMEEIDNTASAGGWYKLDTSYQYSDAMLLIEVSNPTSTPTNPAVLTLTQRSGRLFHFSAYNGKSKLIPVPSLFPGQTIQIPVMMQPNSMQYTPGASMLQTEWNKLAEKGVLLELFGDYGDNEPNKAQIWVH